MAYEIIQQPRFIEPVYNQIIFTVESSNKALCKFKYICDVYVYDKATSTDLLVETIKLYPEPQYGYGVFEISRVLENYLSDTLHENEETTLFKANDASMLRYTVRFGEEYDTSCISAPVGYLDLVSISGNWAYNGVFDDKAYLELKSWNEYTLDNQTRKFLTDAPQRVTVKDNEHYYLSFIQPFTADVNLRVKTYDLNNSLLGDYYFENPIVVDEDDANLWQSVACGPLDLNRLQPSTIIVNPYGLTGYPTIITEDVHSYDCWITYRTTIDPADESLPDNNLLTEKLTEINGDNDPCGTSWSYVDPSNNLVFNVVDGACEESNQALNGPRTINGINFFQPGVYYQVTVEFQSLTVQTDVTLKLTLGDDTPWSSESFVFNSGVVANGFVTARLLSTGDGLLRLSVSSPNIADYAPYSFQISSIKIQLVGPEEAPIPLGTYIASAISEKRSFSVCRCKKKYEPVRLRFLNRKGGHDHFTFNLKSTYRLNTERTSYSKIRNKLTENGSSYDFSSRGQVDFYGKTREEIVVNSDWVSEAESKWLNELALMSMNVYRVENVYNLRYDDIYFEAPYTVIEFLQPHQFQAGEEFIVQFDNPEVYGESNFVATVIAFTELSILFETPPYTIPEHVKGHIYKTTSKLTPVNILTTEAENKRVANEKLFNVSISFRDASLKGQQRA